MIAGDKESVVFTAVNGSELHCCNDHRGEPLRPVLVIDFHDKENHASLSIFLEADEALALGDLIGRIFSLEERQVGDRADRLPDTA